MRWLDTRAPRLSLALLAATATAAFGQDRQPDITDALIYFTQSWCPVEAEVRRLSNTLILARRGCCIVYGSPRDPGGVPAGALTPWRDKIVPVPDGQYCRASESVQNDSDRARIRAFEAEDEEIEMAKVKADARHAVEQLVQAMGDMDQRQFCTALGLVIRSGERDAIKAFRAAAAKRRVKVDEKRTMVETIGIGISSCQLYASWGSPESENRSVGPWGVHTQHVFGSRTYVYTRNGIVTSWQD